MNIIIVENQGRACQKNLYKTSMKQKVPFMFSSEVCLMTEGHYIETGVNETLSCLVLSCLVLSCLVLPCLVSSCLVLSCGAEALVLDLESGKK